MRDDAAVLASGDASAALGGFLITGRSGLLSGPSVATHRGWCPVESLTLGDRVLTFDHRMQAVTDIQRDVFAPPEGILPDDQRLVRVPAGALFNDHETFLMPEQGVIIESDEVCDAMGDPYAVVPANALLGLRGIEPVEPGPLLQVTTLAFDGDEAIYLEGDLLVYCPHPQQPLFDTGAQNPLYPVLSGASARNVAARLLGGGHDEGGLVAPFPGTSQGAFPALSA
ncbi:Hint domain-containing protein [Ruegeria sp. 2205SS24-7]|uniref:Hint domain-containing protein n=1 Tax=Ruegeria discodermiae TaxID=3064389 RepID=UPI00274253E7|nr:Hint domain-containing protein [Ruegeria sp. 2205SS24-7]MDP5216951.1 Hint domain-containing protein [Ruegeria sp. 2205SS24-7]